MRITLLRCAQKRLLLSGSSQHSHPGGHAHVRSIQSRETLCDQFSLRSFILLGVMMTSISSTLSTSFASHWQSPGPHHKAAHKRLASRTLDKGPSQSSADSAPLSRASCWPASWETARSSPKGVLPPARTETVTEMVPPLRAGMVLMVCDVEETPCPPAPQARHHASLAWRGLLHSPQTPSFFSTLVRASFAMASASS